MKVSMGIGWPVLAVALGAGAYGWRGAFWAFVGMYAYIYAVFPLLATIVKRGMK